MNQSISATCKLPLICIFILLNDLWCSAAPSTWTGSVSSDWFNANNWSPAGVPGSNGTIYVTNGAIDLTGLVNIDGVFHWSGGTLSGDSMTIGSSGVLNIAGSVNLQNVLTNNGTVTMTGTAFLSMYNDHNVSYRGGVYNLAGALWDIQTNAIIYNEGLGGEFFNNAGTFRKSLDAAVASISVPFTNSATVTNLAGGLYFQGGGLLASTYDTAAGSSTYFASGNFSMGVPPAISGAGVCEFSGTTLTLTENVPTNLVLGSGNVVLGSAFQNHGGITNLTLSGSTLTGTNSVTGLFTWDGGTLTGPLTIKSGGVLNIAGSVNLENLLTNNGTVTMTGPAFLYVYNDRNVNYHGGVYNLAGALWDIQTNAIIYNEGLGGEFFNNAGTFRKSLDAAVASISVPFTNSATVTNLAGGLYFQGGGLLASTYDTAAGSSTYFASGNFSMGVPPVISGAGVCEFSGTTLTLTENVPTNLVLASGNVVLGSAFQNHGGITNLTLSGSTLVGTNTVTGRLTWDTGTINGPMTIESGGVLNIAGNVNLENVLTNAGTVTMTGTPDLSVYNDHDVNYHGGVYNLAGALWDIQTNAIIYNEDLGGEFFDNAGLFRKSLGSGEASISVPFTNSATVTNLAGGLYFQGGGLLASTYDTAAGSSTYFASGNFSMGVPPVISGAGLCEFVGTTLTLTENVPTNLVLASGNVVLGSAFQNHGGITNLTLSGSTLVGTNTVTGRLTWDTGTINGPMTIETGGVLNIAGNVNLENVLTNAGTVTMTGTAFMAVYNNHGASYNGGVYNLPGALWDFQTNATIYDEGLGDEFFNNAGTVRKSLGSDVASIYVPFTNTSAVDALVGTLSFANSFTTAGGTLAFGVSGAHSFGQIDISGAVALNGTAGFTWLDGFIPAVSNSFPVLDYGSHSGNFANLSLPSGYLGQGNYAATVFSLLITSESPPTNQPVLSIERVNAETVVVLWPAAATNYMLQTFTNLSSTNWNNITSGITAVGTNDVFTNTVNGKAAFFRLESP